MSIQYDNQCKNQLSEIPQEQLYENVLIDSWMVRIMSGEPIQHILRDIFCQEFDKGFQNRIDE